VSPEELRPWDLVILFEGGAVYTAERDGRFFVIIDEGTLEFVLEGDDLSDLELTKTIEFNSLQDRTTYLSNRFRISNDHSRTN
jgi:hypothetical protein